MAAQHGQELLRPAGLGSIIDGQRDPLLARVDVVDDPAEELEGP
jgi:hypothetical protein